MQRLYFVVADMYFLHVCICSFLFYQDKKKLFSAHCTFTAQISTLHTVYSCAICTSFLHFNVRETSHPNRSALLRDLKPSFVAAIPSLPLPTPCIFLCPCSDLAGHRELKAFCATTDVYLIWERRRLAGV